MPITEAKKLIGQTCAVYWTDREGHLIRCVSRIYDATFVPLYGGYLVTETDDVRLDRIRAVEIVSQDGIASPFFGQPEASLPVAA